jgi:ketosteroid isomerase-like protein
LRRLALLAAAVAMAGASRAGPQADPQADRQAGWQAQVRAVEQAFARSMAERDHAAFVALLSEQSVFIARDGVLRGRSAVAAGWKPYFDGPQAPFSWAPEQVEVLADGTLAHSSGPVWNPAGQLIARFNSIWRQEAPGVWRIVFDKGQPP